MHSAEAPCADGKAGCQRQSADFGTLGPTSTKSPAHVRETALGSAARGAGRVEGPSGAPMNQLSAALVARLDANHLCHLSRPSPHPHGAPPPNPGPDLTPEFWGLTS